MFSRPATLDDALTLISAADAVVLSGGTDFYPQRLNQQRHESIVDISAVAELRGITETAGGLRIGATTTWTDIARADLPPVCNGLRSAARQVGGAQIQNVATVAGNLCTASPAADGVPALLTLDASVEVRSAESSRSIPLDEFIVGYRSTALRHGELVTAVTIPKYGSGHGGEVGSSFVKLGSRSYLVISIVMVAALIRFEDDSVVDARIAVGSCSPVARRLASVEAALTGCRADEASIAEAVRGSDVDLSPIDDVRASADYRRTVVGQLIVDAVVACRAPTLSGVPS